MGVSASVLPEPATELQSLLQQLGDTLRGVSVSLITTVDRTGIMHTRQLPNTNVGCDGKLRFLTTTDTALVSEVRQHPNVLVTFPVHGTQRFLVVKGAARICDDRESVRRLWHPALATWFPEGDADPGLVVLEVKVGAVEVWN